MKKLLILLICLIAIAVFGCNPAMAQITPKQVDSIRNVVTAELAPKIAQELQKEYSVYIVCFSKKKAYAPLFIIKGYIKGGQYLDAQHKPLPYFFEPVRDANGVAIIMDRVPQVPFNKQAIKKP